MKIVETVSGSVTSTKQHVWKNSDRIEERDGAGLVTKQFYSRGQRNGSNNLFYNKDHLGSIRGQTNDAASVQAAYSFDPYGRAVVLEETVSSAFGFSGYYVHTRSGLDLTRHRAYSANLGRWLNRDPLGEKVALNLHAYCLNDPVNLKDSTGLQAGPLGRAAERLGESLRLARTLTVQGLTGGGQHYGNWGGGRWANGRRGPDTTTHNFPHTTGDEGYRPPQDPRDYCYYLHDLCLHNAAIDPNENYRTCYRKRCDLGLADCLTLSGLFGPEPTGWRQNPNDGPGPWAPNNEYYVPDPPDPDWDFNPVDFQPPPPIGNV